MNKSSTVRGAMSPTPHTIGSEQTLATAHALMRQHGVRHLPVLHGGKLLGIVSQRDLFFVESLKDVDPERVTVEEAMTQEPYVVDAETPLPEVVRTMAQSRYGAALVTEKSKVVGIFTAVDALHLLATLLDEA
jgi:acetoin utilization protein AcuB